MATQHLCVVRVALFLYVEKTSQYDDFGEVGCTIVGTLEQNPVYKLGCYNEKNEYICTANIGPSNEASANVALQGNYVSFRDEVGKTWSLQFNSEEDAIEFCGSVAAAMFGASGQPANSIIVCDVVKGEADKIVLSGSLVKVRFSSWVLQCNGTRAVPKLGSKLDGTEQHFLTVAVPANHLHVTSEMKGFEGMMIGMREKSSRFIVIPKAVHRGLGPQVSMCYFVEVVRIKPMEPTDNVTCGNQLSIVATASSAASESPTAQSESRKAAAAQAHSAVVPGFDRDQFLLVDRLHDQVFTLTEQLREAKQRLQVFGADVRSLEQQQKPKSLLDAQIEYSVHNLLKEVAEQSQRLLQREDSLRQMEDKSTELRRVLEKLQGTSNVLAEERKSNMTSQDEERLELDRQILQAQTHLNRLTTEVEDTARHTGSIKRVLDQTSSDTKKEKNELQIAVIAYETNGSKLATVKDSLREETERARVVESCISALDAELQTLQSDIQSKDKIIEECKRKSASDVVHYEQILEEERRKAAEELRDVRQSLLEELSTRDRRYQEERQRVAQAAYERGQKQGTDDGANEAVLAADMKAREMTLSSQRNMAESKAMEARIRIAKDEKVSDERRLASEAESLAVKLAAEERENSVLEEEIEALTKKRDSTVDRTFSVLQQALRSAKGHVTPRMFLRFLTLAQAGETTMDDALEAREHLEEKRRRTQEKSEVEAWARGAVYNQPTTMPPLFADPTTKATERLMLAGDGAEDDPLFIQLGDVLRVRRVLHADPRPISASLPFTGRAPVDFGTRETVPSNAPSNAGQITAAPRAVAALPQPPTPAAVVPTTAIAATPQTLFPLPGGASDTHTLQTAAPAPTSLPSSAPAPAPPLALHVPIAPIPSGPAAPLMTNARQPPWQFNNPFHGTAHASLVRGDDTTQPLPQQSVVPAQQPVATKHSAFPAPHVRPLSDFAPPPSLNE